MKIGDKIKVKGSYYSPVDFTIKERINEEATIVKVLDETYNLYLVKGQDGNTFQVTYKGEENAD